MRQGLVDTGGTNRGVVSSPPSAPARPKKVAISEQLHVFETKLRTSWQGLSRILLGCANSKRRGPSSKPNAGKTWRRDLQWRKPIVSPHYPTAVGESVTLFSRLPAPIQFGGRRKAGCRSLLHSGCGEIRRCKILGRANSFLRHFHTVSARGCSVTYFRHHKRGQRRKNSETLKHFLNIDQFMTKLRGREGAFLPIFLIPRN